MNTDVQFRYTADVPIFFCFKLMTRIQPEKCLRPQIKQSFLFWNGTYAEHKFTWAASGASEWLQTKADLTILRKLAQ